MDTKEKVDALYTYLIGINGNDGFIKQGQRAFERVEVIEKNMVTKKQCGEIRGNKNSISKYWIALMVPAVISVIAILRSFL